MCDRVRERERERTETFTAFLCSVSVLAVFSQPVTLTFNTQTNMTKCKHKYNLF